MDAGGMIMAAILYAPTIVTGVLIGIAYTSSDAPLLGGTRACVLSGVVWATLWLLIAFSLTSNSPSLNDLKDILIVFAVSLLCTSAAAILGWVLATGIQRIIQTIKSRLSK